MNAVLLYSEIPRGMKSYGPKAIIPIGKQKTPIIIKQIKALTKYCNKIYIAVGFEKTKIFDIISAYGLTSLVEYIDNDKYAESNDGAILKQFLTHNNEKEGTLFIQGGVLLSSIRIPTNDSIFYIKNKLSTSSMNGFEINIFCNSFEEKASHLFYDNSAKTWAEIFYISYNTKLLFHHMINEDKLFDSMFLFECINLAIDSGIVFDLINVNQKIKKINHHKYAI